MTSCHSIFLVGVTGFEPTTSWSRTKRATNCATPRLNFLPFTIYMLLAFSFRQVAPKALPLSCHKGTRGLGLQTVHRTLCLTLRPNCATPRLNYLSFTIYTLLAPIFRQVAPKQKNNP